MMDAQLLALMAYLAPLSLWATAGLAALNVLRTVELTFRVGCAVSLCALGLMLGLGAVGMVGEPLVSPLIGFGGIGLSLRVDGLSALMAWLVTLLGALLIQFSRNYLDGDPHQKTFFIRLYVTVGAVLLMVLSGNLYQLVLAWVLTSMALHRLLVFYPERPRAIRAARKKFILARVGDVSLIVAAALLFHAFGTADLGLIREAARTALAEGVAPVSVSAAALLVAFAAILKSAVFPFHSWLTEVMETPTPVSALLHAGLINAGTFLVVRFGELVFLSTPALILLIGVGGLSALVASSAMITQSSVKVSLAYSSAAHMGFMLMLCGFGAHTVALMHLVAHSCYKAHAFLSSGSIIEYTRNTGSQKLEHVPHPLALLGNMALAVVIFIVVSSALGINITKRPAETATIVIFVAAVAYLLVKGNTGKAPFTVIALTISLAALVTLAFFVLEVVGEAFLGRAVAVYPPLDAATWVAVITAVVSSIVVMVISAHLPALTQRPAWRAFYVHLKHGFYANALFDRMIDVLRLAR